MAGRRLSPRQWERIRATQDRRARVTHADTTTSGLEPTQPGLILTGFGTGWIVESDVGKLFRCTARSNLTTPVCGDRVAWQAHGAEEGVIVAVEPRRSLLARPGHGGRSKPIAANLDQLAVIVAPRPEPNEFLIDRYLIAAVAMDLDAFLVVNKVDLLDPGGVEAIRARFGVFQRIGYPLLFASTRGAHGLDDLRARLGGRVSILVGQSGVGKSSLAKALLPDRDIRVQALSAATGRGLHTTTSATLYHLSSGGDLIDSPGVSGFELGDVDLPTLEQGFVEFRPHLGRCQFGDCSHGVEPGCAIRRAVEEGAIAARRLESFRRLQAVLRSQ
ncbi:MAG: ribosome small subunit-dependent GTPase A [Gammaproteobacteria bacterium]